MTDKTGSPTLWSALARAQASMDNAGLNKINPHFRSKYADLAAVREATLPHLNAEGLSIVQTFELHSETLLLLRTRISLTRDDYIESTYPIAIDKPQPMGSAITYGRRYSWAAICGIAADEDDDANDAQGSTPGQKQKSAYKARKDGDYESLTKAMGEATTQAELKLWARDNAEAIGALPDSWQKHLRDDYARTLESLPA